MINRRASEPPRLAYLDGLRGIAALVVFFSHLALVIFPAIFNGLSGMARLRYEWILAGTPLGIFWAANFAVCIFFVMSGLVLSYFYEREGGNFIAVCVRRYVRLVIPILATSLIAWILWRYGLMFNLRAQQITLEGWLKSQYLTSAPSFSYFLSESLWTVFRSGSSAINPALWTMKYEMEGSLGVFLLYALVPQKRLRIFLLIALLPLTFRSYYVCFVGGSLIYEWINAEKRVTVAPLIAWSLLFVGAYMGAFPYNVATPDSFWFGFMTHGLDVEEWHQIGAVPFVFACVALPVVAEFLKRPACRYLGKISFSLYLIHGPIICSFTSFLIVAIYHVYPSNNLAMFVAAAFTVPLVLIVSHFLAQWLDGPATRLSARVGGLISSLTGGSVARPRSTAISAHDSQLKNVVGDRHLAT